MKIHKTNHLHITVWIIATAMILILCLVSCRGPKEDPTAAPTATTPDTSTTAPTFPSPEATTEVVTSSEDDDEGGMEIDDEYTIDISDGESGGGL